jgi:CheY-like chemotaxis protein
MIVWVVDDNTIFRTLAQIQLKKVDPDVNVMQFEHGKSAFEFIKTHSNGELPDLILLDINMPIMNGWEFMEAYSEIRSSIQNEIDIYIVTSSIDQSDREKAKNSPDVKEFIVKPLDLNKVRTILDSRRNN